MATVTADASPGAGGQRRIGCLNCGGSLEGMRSDALHCGASCKREWHRRQEAAAEHGQEVLARAPLGAALAGSDHQAST